MGDLVRRNVLAGLTGASLATVGAVVALPATKPERTPCPTASEHPWRRARQLATELSEALQDLDDIFEGPWRAHVTPLSTGAFPVAFENLARPGRLESIRFHTSELMRHVNAAKGADWDRITIDRESGRVIVGFPIDYPGDDKTA